MPRLAHLKFNDPAPDLELQNADCNPVKLSSLWKDQVLILAFTRHFGCPQCKEMVDQLVDALPAVREKNLALVQKGPRASTFVDPDNLDRGEFVCNVSWRALDRPWQFAPTWSNYTEVWENIEFLRLVENTTFYALTTVIGTLISCTLVAYGFSRFRFLRAKPRALLA